MNDTPMEERARTFILRDLDRANARIAELEAEVRSINIALTDTINGKNHDIAELEAERDRLKAALASIQTITAASKRTFDEMIRDMMYANRRARAALSGEGVT